MKVIETTYYPDGSIMGVVEHKEDSPRALLYALAESNGYKTQFMMEQEATAALPPSQGVVYDLLMKLICRLESASLFDADLELGVCYGDDLNPIIGVENLVVRLNRESYDSKFEIES